jgi:hypothetical protein
MGELGNSLWFGIKHPGKPSAVHTRDLTLWGHRKEECFLKGSDNISKKKESG